MKPQLVIDHPPHHGEQFGDYIVSGQFQERSDAENYARKIKDSVLIEVAEDWGSWIVLRKIPLPDRLVKVLSKHGALTRDELVKSLKVPRTTIYDNLVKLIKQNKVAVEQEEANGIGRPRVYFKLT